MQLFDTHGQRLYLTGPERQAFLSAATKAAREIRTFCTVMTYTGCRISEALALTPRSIDMANQAIVFESLKKRRKGIFRDVPVPEAVIDTLNLVHALSDRMKGQRGQLDKPLWSWSRMTAYRRVMVIMNAAAIDDGPHKSPKGLRHGFGVHAISSGVPLNLLSKWMGHSSLEVTAIYANALGEEQRNIAARMWGDSV